MHQNSLPFKLEFSEDDSITAHAGLPIFMELYQALGIAGILDASIPRPSAHNGIHANAYIQSIVMLLIAGGQTMEDIRVLHADKTVRSLSGIERMPSSDAIGKYIKRETQSKVVGIQRASRAIAERVLRADERLDYTLDADAFEIISEKGEAEKNYKGNTGYMPMAAFISELDVCIASEFRAGNINPATRNLEIIEESVKAVREMGKEIKRIRLDSAGYQAEITNYCEEESIKYTITGRKDSSVLGSIGQIKHWEKFENQEVGETIHCMQAGNEAFRLIVLRRRVCGQLPLGLQGESKPAGGYEYYVIATNYVVREKSTEEVILWHRQRATSENYNKEVKSGIGLEYLPSGEYDANEVWYWIGLLAYNLVIAVKRLLLGGE